MWWVTIPRDEHLALGQLHVLPDAPLVFMAGVRLLDRVVPRPYLQHEVDDLGQRRVERVGAVPASPADVVADTILRDALERVVERVDTHLGPPTVVLDRPAQRQDRVVLVHEHGVVDLQEEPGVHDRPVLVSQRVRHREDELLVRLVVAIVEPVDARGRHPGRNASSTSTWSRAAFRFAMSRWIALVSSYSIGPVHSHTVGPPDDSTGCFPTPFAPEELHDLLSARNR